MAEADGVGASRVCAAPGLGTRRLKVVDAVGPLSAASLTDGVVGASDLSGAAEGTRAPEAVLCGHGRMLCLYSVYGTVVWNAEETGMRQGVVEVNRGSSSKTGPTRGNARYKDPEFRVLGS